MFYSIDRFEDTVAVLQDDDGKNHNVQRSLLPSGASQGDVLSYDGKHYYLDPEETKRRREDIRRLQNKLRKNKKR